MLDTEVTAFAGRVGVTRTRAAFGVREGQLPLRKRPASAPHPGGAGVGLPRHAGAAGEALKECPQKWLQGGPALGKLWAPPGHREQKPRLT